MPWKKTDPAQPASPQHSPVGDLIDVFKMQVMENCRLCDITMKVGDLMKLLEIQKNLSTDSDAEEKFWEIIERIRKEELKDA